MKKICSLDGNSYFGTEHLGVPPADFHAALYAAGVLCPLALEAANTQASPNSRVCVIETSCYLARRGRFHFSWIKTWIKGLIGFMLTLNYLTMVAEHVFAMNTNQLQKDCNPKCDTLLTELRKQSTHLTTEGPIVCLLKWAMNLLDGSLFNSPLVFRNWNTEIWYFLMSVRSYRWTPLCRIHILRKGNDDQPPWITPVPPATGRQD